MNLHKHVEHTEQIYIIHPLHPSITMYLQLTITISNTAFKDILINEMSQIGFEGFEDLDTFFKAFIPKKDLDKDSLNDLIQQYQAYCDISLDKVEEVVEENWNATWEKNFQPIKIDNKVVIRSSEHEVNEPFKHTIIIDPRMAFGTGHHATTWLVIQEMLGIDFSNKKVLDFGCGTSILAIFASQLGANSVLAIDYDPKSVENSLHNLSVNHIDNVKVQEGDQNSIPNEIFDVILANINKNVILNSLLELKKRMSPQANLLLSGILDTDVEELKNKLSTLKLITHTVVHKEGWSMIHVVNG